MTEPSQTLPEPPSGPKTRRGGRTSSDRSKPWIVVHGRDDVIEPAFLAAIGMRPDLSGREVVSSLIPLLEGPSVTWVMGRNLDEVKAQASSRTSLGNWIDSMALRPGDLCLRPLRAVQFPKDAPPRLTEGVTAHLIQEGETYKVWSWIAEDGLTLHADPFADNPPNPDHLERWFYRRLRRALPDADLADPYAALSRGTVTRYGLFTSLFADALRHVFPPPEAPAASP